MNTTNQNNISTLKLLLAGVVPALLFCILFYDNLFHLKPFGLNVPLSLAAFYLLMAAAFGKKFFRLLVRAPFHSVYAVLLSITFVLFNDPVLLSINACLIILLVGEQIMLGTGQALYAPYSVHMVGDSLSCWFSLSFGGIGGAFRQYRNENGSRFSGILIGITIAVPFFSLSFLCFYLETPYSPTSLPRHSAVWNGVTLLAAYSSPLLCLFSSPVYSGLLQIGPRESRPFPPPRRQKRKNDSFLRLFDHTVCVIGSACRFLRHPVFLFVLQPCSCGSDLCGICPQRLLAAPRRCCYRHADSPPTAPLRLSVHACRVSASAHFSRISSRLYSHSASIVFFPHDALRTGFRLFPAPPLYTVFYDRPFRISNHRYPATVAPTHRSEKMCLFLLYDLLPVFLLFGISTHLSRGKTSKIKEKKQISPT